MLGSIDFSTHLNFEPHTLRAVPTRFAPSTSILVRVRKDAVRHVVRIHRVLGLKRGNLMLVGVGGSGRQSLTRLAAYISGQELFMIEITKNYRQVRTYRG